MEQTQKSVMIIGGGVAGIQSALDLADMGIYVDLIEKKPCIGGRMAQLDKTFPTNDCSICILAPKLSECFRHPNINLHTLSEVKGIKGEEGNFSVEVFKQARFVKGDACINCGLCVEACPTKVDDEFDRGLRKRKAIYIYYLQGVPSVMSIDKDKCLYLTRGACRLCEKKCEKNAIDFDQKDETVNFNNIGAVIVATGYDMLEDVVPLTHYGYGKFKNVITALEFERLICASGPQDGHLKRLSDNVEPKKIAYLQCVGSRAFEKNDYCSAVCCMYTTKEAMIAKEHQDDLKSYIFYIDMRGGGKGFQKFIKRGEDEYNITYIKCKIGSIKENTNQNLILAYENLDNDSVEALEVDLVVLATCIVPSQGSIELAKNLGIELDKFNFIKSNEQFAIETSKPGILACGCVHEPMDIPKSVTEASAAAAKAAEIIRRRD